MTCKRAGVWATAEQQQVEADEKAAQLEPPEEHLPRHLWSCWKCKTMNLRHDLVCCVASCGEKASAYPEVAGRQGRLDVL